MTRKVLSVLLVIMMVLTMGAKRNCWGNRVDDTDSGVSGSPGTGSGGPGPGGSSLVDITVVVSHANFGFAVVAHVA